MKKIVIGFVGLSCATLAGCTEVESEDVNTDGIYAAFTIDTTNQGSRVSGNLNVGGSGANATNVELVGDDKLEATIGDDTKVLQKNQEIIDINDPHYSAFFDGVVEAGAEVKVAFLRKVDDGAPSSTVALASEANAEGPSGTQSRESAELVVSFENGGDDESTTVGISGECFQSASQSVDGDNATSVTFAPGALKEPEAEEGEDPPTPTTCEATVTITRTRTGKIDPAFGEGGVIQASRSESLTFQSAP